VITSLRMYSAAPGAARAWRALFERVFADVGIDVGFIQHRYPEPIDALWKMDDLCCDFMCGWPFVRSEIPMQPIAVPVPSPARYEGLPRYCSEFLVREASAWTTLEETFGHRIGWMAENSQSGFNAPRAYLSRFASPEHPALFRESIGPFGSPSRTLDALRVGQVDVVALDSFLLDLLRRHDPAKLEGIRCVATTPWTPIPLLVAAPHVSPDVVQRLRARLLRLHTISDYEPLLADVLGLRFAAADSAAYSSLEAIARAAVESRYEVIR
jgi:ABC-type phosphate/phosphonate transport system substrate-binding protein